MAEKFVCSRFLILGLALLGALAGCGEDGESGPQQPVLNLEEFQVHPPGTLASEVSVAMGPDGRFAVLYGPQRFEDPVRLQGYTAGAIPDGPPIAVLDRAVYQAHVVAAPDGQLAVTALDDRDLVARRFAADRSPLRAMPNISSSTR
jgi:hypothetical protein